MPPARASCGAPATTVRPNTRPAIAQTFIMAPSSTRARTRARALVGNGHANAALVATERRTQAPGVRPRYLYEGVADCERCRPGQSAGALHGPRHAARAARRDRTTLYCVCIVTGSATAPGP